MHLQHLMMASNSLCMTIQADYIIVHINNPAKL